MHKKLNEEISRINQLLTEDTVDDVDDVRHYVNDMSIDADQLYDEVLVAKDDINKIWDDSRDDFDEDQLDHIAGAILDIADAEQSIEDTEDELTVTALQLDDLSLSLQEMRFDGKSTGLFSNEETVMNELDDEEEEGEWGWEGDPWDYIEYGGFMDDEEEEELPTVRRSDRDRARRRPYNPQARFRGGLSEQERPARALDRELTYALDELHDDIWYTIPGQHNANNLGIQVQLYQQLKSMLDAYPASKSLPEVKQILDRMEYDLSGLEGFNERLADLFYLLTGRWEFSPEGRE